MGMQMNRKGGPMRLNVEAIIRHIASTAPGLIVSRVDEGRDKHDKPLAGYTARYRDFLRMGLENDNDVDLRLTGGMLASVKARDVRVESNGTIARVTIAPDAGTSPQVALKHKAVSRHGAAIAKQDRVRRKIQAGKFGFDAHVAANKSQRAVDRTMGFRKTGKRGPAHNVVGYWLQHGTAHMRARPWLGLSPSDLADIRTGLRSVKIWTRDGG